MATNLLNRAEISYTNGTGAATAVSNQTNTSFLDEYAMTAVKESLAAEVRAGDNAAFTVSVENSGIGTLTGITVTDDLGGGELTYVDGSARFYINGAEVTGTASAVTGGELFSVTAPLNAGDILLVAYLATLSATATTPVTNTATVEAAEGTAAAIVTTTATATVTPLSYAAVSVFKTADKETVINGDSLTYTFMLMNTGSDAAESVLFTDAFPTEFTVTGVSYTVNGTTVPVAPTDYSITVPNTLVMPAAGSTLALSVPAATAEGPGVMTVTVTGTVSDTTTVE